MLLLLVIVIGFHVLICFIMLSLLLLLLFSFLFDSKLLFAFHDVCQFYLFFCSAFKNYNYFLY